MNEIKKISICIIVCVFFFSIGFFSGNDRESKRLLYAAKQQLESVRIENNELRNKLKSSNERIDNIKRIIERSRNDSGEAKEIIRQSKQIIERLIKTIQQIEDNLHNGGSNSK